VGAHHGGSILPAHQQPIVMSYTPGPGALAALQQQAAAYFQGYFAFLILSGSFKNDLKTYIG